jgi:cytochrome c peroxidase
MIKYCLLLIVSLGLLTQWEIDEPKTRAELGRKLFFDPILSKDTTISCASCHKPEFAFADTSSLSRGVNGKLSRRNTPSVMNMRNRTIFFYDGRASTLREQVHFPIEDPHEMNLSMKTVTKRLRDNPTYNQDFLRLYKEEPNKTNIEDAIARFEMTLETSDTDFDKWMNNLPNRMFSSAINGRAIFMSDRAKCLTCHFTPDFTGDLFRNIGLYDEKKYNDKGRYEVTKDKKDLGKFKVPGLRNVAITAPYMHDGSFKSLEEVIDYYSNPYDFIEKPINIDTSLLKPINFSSQEKKDLLAFLNTLTDQRFK